MPFEALLSRLVDTKNPDATVGRSGPGTVARLAVALLQKGRSVVLLAKDQAQLAEYRALLTLLTPERSLGDPSPSRTVWGQRFITVPQPFAGRSGKGGWSDRMAALYALRQQRPAQGVVAGIDNFILRLPPVDIFDTHELPLFKGMTMSPDLVLEQAVDWGYMRAPMVSTPGEIAVRGDILDIYCPGYIRPLRLEFFGDTLEDIRLFDPANQRSVADIDELIMLPVAPVIVSRALRKEADAFWKREREAGHLATGDVAALTRAADAGGRELFAGMFYERASCLEEWLPKDAVCILPPRRDVLAALERAHNYWADHLRGEAELTDLCQSASRVLRPVSQAEALLEKAPRVHFEGLRLGVPEDEAGFALPEKEIHSFQELFFKPEMQERPWQYLVALMRVWSARKRGEKDGQPPEGSDQFMNPRPGSKLVLSFSSERARARFLKLAGQDGITPHLRFDAAGSGLFALVSPFRKGLHLLWENMLVLGEDVMQPKVERARKIPRGAFQGLDRYDTLRDGDYLVHRDYGVGIFMGLHRMNLGNIQNDYLLLHYAGQDKLYLPVDHLSLIQRFRSAEGAQPAPDRLGGSQWATSKDKARKAIEKIAADLVEMYALRKVAKGFRYGPVSEMYREFEATFGFEETPDQARAIEDVLADMEKPEPMDRLVCGDVGFGKTEVALRAAFRAVLEGRQVVLLCPTTILAEQHYQTFRSRLAGFPVNVGMLSRFVSKARQKEVLAAASKGQVDILIGTHRLLSKDVSLPSLGLLILDEEQRFGVRHKERLKEMRNNIDSLALSATPIPRTLQLSLSGIRELSIIETPPLERKPVATALIDRDEATLQNIVEREIARKGQVFWVYNRVQGLGRVVDYVKKIAPGARVGMAHGQMNESALEETMHKFWHGELDVLVCTSIVESGLDFPMANTLVVDQAQLFGLGQLYQLRGRVGRSDRQAYAVFVTPDPDKLPEQTRQRMRIILDLDYLGAGFEIAMEDLRLRGAGNILGESQSGHMNRLGLDLFLEMLEEAVAKLKGQPVQVCRESEISLGIPAYIPEGYMSDAKERLRYYKLLSSASDEQARRDVVFEIRDRFGVLPDELENFTAVLGFKGFLTELCVQKADIFADKLRLFFGDGANLDPARLVAFVASMREKGQKVRLQPPAVLELPLSGGTVDEALLGARRMLEQVVGAPQPANG